MSTSMAPEQRGAMLEALRFARAVLDAPDGQSFTISGRAVTALAYALTATVRTTAIEQGLSHDEADAHMREWLDGLIASQESAAFWALTADVPDPDG